MRGGGKISGHKWEEIGGRPGDGEEAGVSQADEEAESRDEAEATRLERERREAPPSQEERLNPKGKGQIEIDFKPEEPSGPAPIRKQLIGMDSTGGRVKAAGWVVRDLDGAVSLLSQFKDHAQENLFLIATLSF